MQKNMKKWWPVFLLPTFAAFVIGFIIPFVQGVYLSFCKFQTINKTTFIGVSNYVKAFADTQFTQAFWFTVRFTVVSTLLIQCPAADVLGLPFCLLYMKLAAKFGARVMVGVGIGGTFEKCAQLSKFALMRELGSSHPLPEYRSMEQELLAAINELGIGPQGFGGRTTCLGLAIEQMPTHVAGLPAAVNVSCHVTRRASAEL